MTIAQHLSTSNERYTPEEIITPMRLALGGYIELDPASCEEANKTVKADRYFTEADNGLMQSWKARSVWVNPPYGTNADLGVSNQLLWVKKIAKEYALGHFEAGAILVSAATGDQFFREIWRTATLVCFPFKRIKFNAPDGTQLAQPPNANAIAYYGKGLSQFIHYASAVGAVVKCYIDK
jgi:DNA N-6-adenine-methyltransferase (Dam)